MAVGCWLLDVLTAADLPPDSHTPRTNNGNAHLSMLKVEERLKAKAGYLYRCRLIAEQIAVRGVEVDALDEQAETFYRQYGFQRLTDRPLHLYLSMGVIRRLGG